MVTQADVGRSAGHTSSLDHSGKEIAGLGTARMVSVGLTYLSSRAEPGLHFFIQDGEDKGMTRVRQLKACRQAARDAKSNKGGAATIHP